MTIGKNLEKIYGQKFPNRLKKFYSDEMEKFDEKPFDLRYAKEKVKANFSDTSLLDLAEWMDSVGLGDDINWLKEGDEYDHRLPFATLTGKSEHIQKYLLAVDTQSEKCQVFLWTEGTFFKIFPSLDEFLQALGGADPIENLSKALDKGYELSSQKKYQECIDVLNSALKPLESITKNFKKDGDSDQSSETIEVLGRAYLLIGYCQFQLKNHKEAEAAYSQAFALGEQSAGGNLARMYFWNQHDYKKTLNHLDVLFKNEYSKDGLELIDELRFLSYVMLGQGEEAKKQLMKPADDDMAIAPKVAIKSLEKLRKEMPTGSHLTLIDELLKMATELSAPKKFANDRDWWSSLPPFWKMYFESVLEIERDAQPTDKQLATVAAMETVEPPSRFKDPNKKGSLGGGIYPETLAPLSHLKKLRHLKVKSQKRWDLEPIAQCPELETLDLSESDLNDIAPLAKLSKLTELNIGKSDIENISALAHCKELKKLNIWKSGVSDLSPLVQCSKLEELLAGNIEARTLPLLKELKQLKRLELLFSYVPASEVEAFKEAHPGCEVKHSPKS